MTLAADTGADRHKETVSDSDLSSQLEEAHGCLMCHSLYIKANGEMPCWDDVGERKVLRHLDYKALLKGDEQTLFYCPELLGIREAYLSGHEPFPGLCCHCAVRGHGVATEIRPKKLEILHVEASFLCHLACPQCIPPAARRSLKGPPYNLPPDVYQSLLLALLREGVREIRLVHFEGRGDPLMNPDLGLLIRTTKKLYPRAFVKVTTHGNYPFRPWIVESGLDLLRLSVDGAFPENYAKYRVGGSLEAALSLMKSVEDHRRHSGATVRVEWKYLLFEWNDSPQEMLEAARLADSVGADLKFCLTHSPGRSNRIRGMDSLESEMVHLGITASPDLTFQLKTGPSRAAGDSVVGDHCAALLRRALRLLQSGDRSACQSLLAAALLLDPGVEIGIPEDSKLGITASDLKSHAATIRHPSTASALANIAHEFGDASAAETLFRRYLAMAPAAPDREKVDEMLVRIIVENRLGFSTGEMSEATLGGLVEAQEALLEFDPGPAGSAPVHARKASLWRTLPELVETVRSPRTLIHLAYLRWFQGDPVSAIRLSERFLELSPGTEDHLEIRATILNFRKYRWRCKLLYLTRRISSWCGV